MRNPAQPTRLLCLFMVYQLLYDYQISLLPPFFSQEKSRCSLVITEPRKSIHKYGGVRYKDEDGGRKIERVFYREMSWRATIHVFPPFHFHFIYDRR